MNSLPGTSSSIGGAAALGAGALLLSRLAKRGDGPSPGGEAWLRAEQLEPGLRPELVPPTRLTSHEPPAQLRVVTYNIHRFLGRDVPRLARVFREHPQLRSADVIMMQEVVHAFKEGMSGAARLARELGMWSAYAPAIRRQEGTQGLAILSRHPLSNLRVLQLRRLEVLFFVEPRIAFAATCLVGDQPVELINVHLDTCVNTKYRLEQLRPVAERALKPARAPVIIAGDVNTLSLHWYARSIPVFHRRQAAALDRFMIERGFLAPAADVGRTHRLGMRLDAFFVRNGAATAAFVERDVKASDHYPLRLDVTLPS